MTVALQYSTLKNGKLHTISYTVQTISTQSYTQSYITVQFNICEHNMETSAYVGLVTYSLWQVIILCWPRSPCSGIENCAVYKICFSSQFASLLAPDLYSAEDYTI